MVVKVLNIVTQEMNEIKIESIWIRLHAGNQSIIFLYQSLGYAFFNRCRSLK